MAFWLKQIKAQQLPAAVRLAYRCVTLRQPRHPHRFDAPVLPDGRAAAGDAELVTAAVSQLANCAQRP